MSASVKRSPKSIAPAVEQTALKSSLLMACVRLQQEKADVARRAMEDVQASANDHSGAMEDKFESFRENCQIQRDLFARQLDDALTGLATLRRIVAEPEPVPDIGLGALVETDRGARFFVSISLGPVPDPTAGAPWLAISTHSPIGQAMLGKRVGDDFTFRGEKHVIKSIA